MEGCMGNGINKEMEMIMGEFCIFEFSVMKKNYKKEQQNIVITKKQMKTFIS